jgi:predicted DNA-binding protein (MmcQ/YjbR family)
LAIGGWGGDGIGITFEVDALDVEFLKQQPGLRPAPYWAARGMTSIQHYAAPRLSADELRDHLRASCHMASVD